MEGSVVDLYLKTGDSLKSWAITIYIFIMQYCRYCSTYILATSLGPKRNLRLFQSCMQVVMGTLISTTCCWFFKGIELLRYPRSTRTWNLFWDTSFSEYCDILFKSHTSIKTLHALFSLKKKTPSHLSDLSVIVWFWLQKNLPPKEVAWFKGQKPWTWSIFGGRGFKQELKVFWCWDFHPQELLLSLVPFGPLRYINIRTPIYIYILFVYIHTYILAKIHFLEYVGEFFPVVAESRCVYIQYFLFGCHHMSTLWFL